MSELSDRIKLLRSKKGNTQKHMAEKLSINERTYRRYESGEIEPSLMILIQLANYFDVSIDYLMGQTENPKRN